MAGKGKASGARKVKGAPPRKNKGGNGQPARARYWAEHRLERHKIRNLMQHNGLSRAEATRFWLEVRHKRKK